MREGKGLKGFLSSRKVLMDSLKEMTTYNLQSEVLVESKNNCRKDLNEVIDKKLWPKIIKTPHSHKYLPLL